SLFYYKPRFQELFTIRKRFFLGFGCGAAQGDFISQCAAVWIRTIKMVGNGEHMHFVSDNPGHFYGE
ncbi:hypothetical protein, partial [Hungatella hathewayi]|uniref:hypothetical protein n=1 Tax=Hungatella hathewayi TaxID=154046 RepID=UPI001A9A36BE